jgi:high-affinity K+ transport system ATPase subunit B
VLRDDDDEDDDDDDGGGGGGVTLIDVSDDGVMVVVLVLMLSGGRCGVVIVRCKAAGVRVFMITGDHPLTAESIARQVTAITTCWRWMTPAGTH